MSLDCAPVAGVEAEAAAIGTRCESLCSFRGLETSCRICQADDEDVGPSARHELSRLP